MILLGARQKPRAHVREHLVVHKETLLGLRGESLNFGCLDVERGRRCLGEEVLLFFRHL